MVGAQWRAPRGESLLRRLAAQRLGSRGPRIADIVILDNIGRRQYFQGDTVYWRLNEAYYVTGVIRDKWVSPAGKAAGSATRPATKANYPTARAA
ncbi:hypothetical protein ACLB9X_07645 [Streptomyces sp. 5K101]|uniref:hypothetical protein n=1 Tax=Streptomyces sp. 5K101 TaxID=3390037 RepID=UPI003976B714